MRAKFASARIDCAAALVAVLWSVLFLFVGPPAVAGDPPPNVVFITVDTLRADRVSSYGYDRPTTPNIDRLLAAGVRFEQARTIEPLTSPSLCSMLTSVYPHVHGSSRNGLRLVPGLDSLPKQLERAGYRTAAFVGNWTLREKLSGLDEHFQTYEMVLTRKRWFGLLRREATAEDLNEQSLAWVTQHRREHPNEPFFLWVHYTEPHAPYRLQEGFAEQLGLPDSDKLPPADRYDTEVAFVDAAVGHLLAGLEPLSPPEETLIVFSSDHGESLGEHGYWGHGRHLYEPTLRIPMGMSWKGHLNPATVDAPALIVDLAPTVLRLLDLDTPKPFIGYDWTAVLQDGQPGPYDRVTHYQAHKGAVITNHDSDLARQAGLIEVGLIHDNLKEVFRVKNNRHWVFNLKRDPLELADLTQGSDPTEGLKGWMRVVNEGLGTLDNEPPPPLDEESIEQLRSLGYVD